jgi:hypothetical protein
VPARNSQSFLDLTRPDQNQDLERALARSALHASLFCTVEALGDPRLLHRHAVDRGSPRLDLRAGGRGACRPVPSSTYVKVHWGKDIQMATKKAEKPPKKAAVRPAKYPRHSVEKALRIPKAILEENGGHASTPSQAAGYLGLKTPKGPFSVEIGSAKKYGFLDSPEPGKIQPTELARRILRPKSHEDQLEAYREAVLKAPDISDVYKHYRGENIP